MTATPFQNISVAVPSPPTLKRRYSVTSDIVAFRRCARQYGAFNVKKYAPAHQTQLYFGTILHQVLDHCHQHFHGTHSPATRGQLPDGGQVLTTTQIESYFQSLSSARTAGSPMPPPPTDIIRYFLEVEDGLKSRGIRAVTPDLRLKAVRILQYFNALEGPDLYPRVVDSELRLQADQQTHVLHGVVDLLADAPGSSGAPAECEMWDYKGSSRVGMTTADLDTYRFQMRVYARLYELKHGVLPTKAILYFLNELDGPQTPASRPVNAVLEVDLDPMDIQQAMTHFGATVTQIEQARLNDTWPAAQVGGINDQDCAICDLRWDCQTPNNGQGVKMRIP